MPGPKQYIFPVQLRHVQNEELTGTIDGLNDEFQTVNAFIETHFNLYVNGLRQVPGITNDYIILDDKTIQMINPPLPGDVLLADYLSKNC